jgi:RNA 2',3'-cyclic 3'-phosphodiesterase
MAEQLALFIAGLEASFVRAVAPADIHLTLVPPWNETAIPDAIAKLGRVTGRFSGFWLDLCYVGYRPQPRRPRLVWVDSAIADDGALHGALLEAFGRNEVCPSHPHVALARIQVDGSAISRKHRQIGHFPTPAGGNRRALSIASAGRARPYHSPLFILQDGGD